MKKAYITPGIEEMAAEPESLLAYSLTSTTEGINTDENPDMTNDDNRSRTFKAWEDDDLGDGF